MNGDTAIPPPNKAEDGISSFEGRMLPRAEIQKIKNERAAAQVADAIKAGDDEAALRIQAEVLAGDNEGGGVSSSYVNPGNRVSLDKSVINVDGIPEELKQMMSWIVWKRVLEEGAPKPKKEPRQARNPEYKAANDNRDHWSTFATAMFMYNDGRADGIGVSFYGSLYLSWDMDDCISDDGILDPEIQAIVDILGSYTELSQSQKGIHIIGIGKIGKGDIERLKIQFKKFKFQNTPGFLYVTGNVYQSRKKIVDITEGIEKLLAMCPAPAPTTPGPATSQRMTQYSSICDSWGLTLDNVGGLPGNMKQEGPGKYRGSHPVHGSTTGGNYRTDGDQWFCERDGHKTGGGPLEFFAVKAGIINCEDVCRGCLDGKFREIFDALRGAGFKEPARIVLPARTPENIVEDIPERLRTPWMTRTRSARFAFTDLGNAERFLHRHSENVRYCTETDTWHIWNGICWEPDRTGKIMLLALDVIYDVLDDIRTITGDDDESKAKRAGLMDWAKKLESLTTRRNMLTSAQPWVAVRSDVWDSNPDVYNLQNGTLDLKTLTVREHRKEDLCSRCSAVVYDKNAMCPGWSKHLTMVFGDDKDLIREVQELFGYSLEYGNSEQIFVIAHGGGNNGKSVTFAVMNALHHGYAASIPVESIMVEKNNENKPRPELIRVLGSRFITTSEGDRNHKLSESMIKKMTGGELMTARGLYEQGRDFKGNFKVFMSTNHLPEIRGTDDAIWRRILRIPFTRKIDAKDKKPFDEIVATLTAESPGIFNWMLTGLKAYRDRGCLFEHPKSVIDAKESYKKREDVFGRFLDEWTIHNPNMNTGECVTKSELADRFNTWAKENGEDALSKKIIYEEMTDRNYTDKKDSTGWWWVGIRLKTWDEHVKGITTL